MGILTRKRGDAYIITSDRDSHAVPTPKAPKRMSDAYRVCTGASWSTLPDDAKIFDTLDIADEYVRVNYAVVSA